MRTLLVAALIGSIAISHTCNANEGADPRARSMVRVDSGLLSGTQADGVRRFLGIPYAAAPVGAGRWRAPRPVEPWQGTRSAEAFGPSCMQPATIGGIPLPPEFADTSEDCLYLNVWAPEGTENQRLPVMIWIHGSGFIFGAGRGFGIDGTSFATRGVIVVSMNYRLGLFGQFAHPALDSEGTGGNYALLDLLAALHWVKRNIAAFGGDPERVTLAGLSAGGSYSQMLMTLPQAKGLFHQVISQSGPTFFGWPTSKEAQQRGEQLFAGTLAKPTAEALRALPAKTITAATIVDDTNGPRPIIDGTLLTDHPARLFTSDRLNARRMIVGTTNFEGVMRAMSPMPPGIPDEQLIGSLGLTDERVQQLYNPTGNKPIKRIAADIDGDRNFVAGSRYVARAMSTAKATAFQYQFAYIPEALRKNRDAAPHGSDQHFVFNQITSAVLWGARATPADKATADLIHSYWISFIKHGDPNGEGRAHWPHYEVARDELLEFTPTGPVVRQQHWKDRLDVTEAVLLREMNAKRESSHGTR